MNFSFSKLLKPKVMNEATIQVKNKVQLFGSINKNPVIRTMGSGRKMASFTIATTEVYYKADQKVFNTQWHFAVAWGKVAEQIETTIKPGTKVTINGKLSNRSYIDKEGQKRYVTEVVVNEFEIYNNA
jgi:single-strand DNA-binding protein